MYNPGKDNAEADCLSWNTILEKKNDEGYSEYVIKTVNFLNIEKSKKIKSS